jgi:hypothetical protein
MIDLCVFIVRLNNRSPPYDMGRAILDTGLAVWAHLVR